MTQNVALVLSSGSARGISHIGVIEELEKSGYTITSVAGTSMGALVGGMLANGTLPAFTDWLLRITKMDVIKFMDLTMGHGGLVKGEKILKALEEFIGDKNIEDLQMPYSCVAADLNGRKEVVFRKGSLLDAIRASISIPTVFQPVIKGNMLLVDGGVLNPLPLDLIQRESGDILVAVNVNASIPYTSPKLKTEPSQHESYYDKMRVMINERWSGVIDQYVEKYRNGSKPKTKQINLFDVISESINLAQNKAALIYIEKYTPEIVIETSFKTASAFDFYKSEELIEAGRIACRKALEGVKIL
jgi:NTE family protein